MAKLLVDNLTKALKLRQVTTLLAEMHKIGISDGTDMDPAQRHLAFEKLGFAPLFFPYIQPPLSAEGGKHTSQDLLLLTHVDLLQAKQAESIVVQEYIDGFCGSVFGFDARTQFVHQPWYTSMQQHLSNKKYIPCLSQMKAPWQEANVLPTSSKIVVVVGGGLSGLACASALRQAGVGVVLMEANAVLGGRVKQLHHFAPWGPIDLGAEFVHGENVHTNPMAQLARANNWEMESLFDITDWGESGGGCRGALAWLPYHADGSDGSGGSDDSGRSGRSGRFVPLSGSTVPDVIAQTKERFEQALQNAVAEETDTTVKECMARSSSNMTVANMAVVDSIVAQTEAMDINASGVHCLVKEDEAFDFGGDNLRLQQSYSVVLHHMIAELDVLGVEICTSAPVYQIQQYGGSGRGSGSGSGSGSGGSSGAKGAGEGEGEGEGCGSGSGGGSGGSGESGESGALLLYRGGGGRDGGEMYVDRVVVTVPPSVLKGPTPLLQIIPPLPVEQQHAINERNFGRAIKVFALCSNGNFWNNRTTATAQAARAAQAASSTTTSDDRIHLVCCCDPTLTFSQLWCDARVGYNEVLICGFVTSTRADALAHCCCPDSKGNIAIEQMLVAQLNVMFGTVNQPTPCSDVLMNTTSYDWGTHPYINGGYSSPQCMGSRSSTQNAKNAETEDSKVTMRGKCGCIHFAGEATHDGACATTQSAVLTGERAAAEVIHALQKQQGGECSLATCRL